MEEPPSARVQLLVGLACIIVFYLIVNAIRCSANPYMQECMPIAWRLGYGPCDASGCGGPNYTREQIRKMYPGPGGRD
jgi:hypothetical protein